MIYIYIKRDNYLLTISDSTGNKERYIYYTKKEALKKFKADHNYRYKRNINIIEF